MSLGPVMLDLEATALSTEERDLLRHPAVGGVILFSRNYRDPQQLSELTAQIRALRDPHLLIAVDQEGGRVQRLRERFTRLPPAAWYGQLYQNNAAQGRRVCELAGWLMASELRSVGVDFSFAPVLDLDSGLSAVIGDRAFGSRPSAVVDLGRAWMRGAHAAGMAAVGKHFPGHGQVVADSHVDLPVDERPLEDMLTDDLVPFDRLIQAGMEGVMPAHVVYRRVDRRPAGFSPVWLRQVLRQRLGFQGAIFSDDLSMTAAEFGGSYPERARAALEAGCDMLLVCNDRAAALQVLDELEDHTDPTAHLRYLRMHGRARRSRDQVHLDPRWRQGLNALAAFEEGTELSLNL